jgi:sugar phosphate isomerase/epimerase
VSSHFQASEIIGEDEAATVELTQATAEYAAAMGLQYVVASSSGMDRDGTVDDFRRWGELMNRAGEVAKSAGLQLGYHNHAIGPEMDNGQLQFDLIMEVLDPDMVKMQFQLLSISGGYDIVEYLNKYAGRYFSLHIADWDPNAPGFRPGTMGSAVPPGEGEIDWPALLEAAAKSPMSEYGYVVELETEEPLDGLTRAISYLRTVEV